MQNMKWVVWQWGITMIPLFHNGKIRIEWHWNIGPTTSGVFLIQLHNFWCFLDSTPHFLVFSWFNSTISGVFLIQLHNFWCFLDSTPHFLVFSWFNSTFFGVFLIQLHNFWCFLNSTPLLLEVSLFSFQGIYAKTIKVLHKIIELAFHLMSPLFFKLLCDESHVFLFFFSWICEFLNKKKQNKTKFHLCSQSLSQEQLALAWFLCL